VNRKKSAGLLIVICVLLTTPIHGEDIKIPALPAPIPGMPSAAESTLRLDLRGAYQMTLSRNLELQVGRYNIAAADENIHAESGIFDPNFLFGVNGDWAAQPSTTVLEGALLPEGRNTRFTAGLGQLLPSGAQWQLDFNTRRSETNSGFYFINPNWTSNFDLGISQPLLRGFGTLVNRAGIVVARNSRDRTAEAFEVAVTNSLSLVENAYWDLVAARRAHGVAQESLDLAQRLLEETQERVKVGTSAPIDLVQSEAGVATRRQDLITLRNVAANAEDALKEILGFDDPDEWMTTIETTETYDFKQFLPDLREAIETGLASRPEMREKRLELEILEYSVRLARNDVLPSLDLEASYGWSGVGGKGEIANPNPPPDNLVVDEGFGDSINQLANRDFSHWRLGIQLGIPIGNNQAQGRLAQKRFEYERGLVELAALKQDVISQVRFAVRALEDGAAAVEAALASRDLAERNLEAEQTKFANGLSTNFQVLEIQEDLSSAQLALIRAYLNYRRASVGYRVATGALLEFLDVEIVDPGSPDIPHDYWKDVEWMQFDDLSTSTNRVSIPAEPVSTK